MAAEAKYDMTVHPTSALVRSQSDGARAHAVTFPSCDCPDFINRRGQLIELDGDIAVTLCKHIAEGLRRVGGWRRPTESEPFVFLGRLRAEAFNLLVSAAGLERAEAVALLDKAVADGQACTGAGVKVDHHQAKRSPDLYTVTIPA